MERVAAAVEWLACFCCCRTSCGVGAITAASSSSIQPARWIISQVTKVIPAHFPFRTLKPPPSKQPPLMMRELGQSEVRSCELIGAICRPDSFLTDTWAKAEEADYTYLGSSSSAFSLFKGNRRRRSRSLVKWTPFV